MEIEAQLRQYIAHNFVFTDSDFDFDADASLLQEGILDSIGMMELVAFVGSAFHLQIDPKEVTRDNFDSLNKLAGFIRSKTAASKPDAAPSHAATAQTVAPGPIVSANTTTPSTR